MNPELPPSVQSAERFDSLFQLLSRKYDIRQAKIRLDDQELTVYAVKNLDDLLDRLIEMNPEETDVKDERLPYWAEIWPSSIALSQYIIRNDFFSRGKRVIELGCGLGLVGMAAAKKEADILLTDYQPDALRFAELNWLLNLGESPAMHVMDWRNPDIDSKFDVIIASDVVYEKRFFWPVINTFDTLLTKDGIILLSEPNRKIAGKFFDLLESEGFRFECEMMKIPSGGKEVEIGIYRITRKT